MQDAVEVVHQRTFVEVDRRRPGAGGHRVLLPGEYDDDDDDYESSDWSTMTSSTAAGTVQSAPAELGHHQPVARSTVFETQ